MREASEWRRWLFVFPGTFFLGFLGIFLADDRFRSVLFQVGTMLMNRWLLFFVGYYWCEERRTRTQRERNASMTHPPGLLSESWRPSGLRVLLEVCSLLLLSVLPTLVAIVFIFLDWTPWWMLLIIQIVIPMYGLSEGVRYRNYLVGRRVLSRWKAMQLVGDEQFR
jgi:hypothetical protein